MHSDLVNMIHAEVERQLAARYQKRVVYVTSYDPERHAFKGAVQPGGQETGWIPIEAQHVGNGFGVLNAPIVGDCYEVTFQEGDLETGRGASRLHSDEDKPPRIEAGEMLLKHQSGSTIFFDKSGNVHIKSKGALYINGLGSTP